MSHAVHPSHARLVCLTGFMGCGKTTIGRQLARQAGWRFVDLDTRIVERGGASITDIFARRGEPAFRELEAEELARAVGEVTGGSAPAVLALGGGTFAQPGNVDLLRSLGPACVVIWLDCPAETLLMRCGRVEDRPLFRDESSFRALLAERIPFYERADYRVDSSGKVQGVVAAILALGILERATPRPAQVTP